MKKISNSLNQIQLQKVNICNLIYYKSDYLLLKTVLMCENIEIYFF